MWLSLLIVALVFAITIYQAMQGLFSAIIMMVLTICCAATAYGTYEWVAVEWIAPYWKRDYAHALALGLIFGVPLLLARLVFDRLIRRACLVPAGADRIGAGACGLVTAFVMVGVAAGSVQQVPFGESILGFSRFDAVPWNAPNVDTVSTPPDPGADERNLWLAPDRLAVSVASMLSNGLFSGERTFYQDHPDLVQEAGWVNTVHRDVSRFAPPRSISVVAAEPVQFVYRLIPGDQRTDEPDEHEPLDPKGGHQFRMIRVKLQNDARDQRKSHLFTLRQFRLVGRGGPDGAPQQYFPIAIQQQDTSDPVNRHIRIRKQRGGDWPVTDTVLVPRDNSAEVELVFELPDGFVPDFVEYKRSARAAVKFDAGSDGSDARTSGARSTRPAPRPPPSSTGQPDATTASDTGAPEPPSRRRTRRGQARTVPDSGRGGRARRLTTLANLSFFGDRMPLELRSYRSLRNVDTGSNELKGGHLLGEVDKQEGGTDPVLSRFDVPSDKRLLHLNVGALQARSTLGRALSQAVSVVQNYVVQDAAGRQYKFIGKYALANVRGQKIIEVQYFPEQVGTVGGVGAFSRIKEDRLGNDGQLVLLFLVEPGVRIVSFSTGGAASRRDDLRSENLTAPP